MKKIISTFAIFTTFSLSAMANAYDESAANNPRFAGLGGLFGNQQTGKVAVTYQRSASNSRFVGLGGLFGNQDESVAAIDIQKINVATNDRFPGLGGPLGGQRTAEISLKSTLESVL